MNKTEISPVIATVFLILITAVAVGIIWTVLHPLIENYLEKEKQQYNAEIKQISDFCQSKKMQSYLKPLPKNYNSFVVYDGAVNINCIDNNKEIHRFLIDVEK